MIRFDRDINRNDLKNRIDDKTIRDKKIRQTTERGTKVDYDFADRDAQPVKSKGNEMLGAVVAEADKVEKPEPERIDKRKRKFDKSSDFNGFYNDYDDTELTK